MKTFKDSNLYVVSDDSNGALYMTETRDGTSFQNNLVGNRGWWTKNLAEFKDFMYAGFYDDWSLYFIMRRTDNPMINSSWQNVSGPGFSDSFKVFSRNSREYTSSVLNANMTVESSCVFKGQLYIGTYNYGYFGRTTTGAQIWRTPNGSYWEQVLMDLYAATSSAFEPCKIYRTDGEYHNGVINWQPVVLDGFGRQYNSFVSSLYPYMGRLYAITASWLYTAYAPKEE
mgnify:CR=1 FL=1